MKKKRTVKKIYKIKINKGEHRSKNATHPPPPHPTTVNKRKHVKRVNNCDVIKEHYGEIYDLQQRLKL